MGLSAITAALSVLDTIADDGRVASAEDGRQQSLELDWRLRQQNRELAAARTRVAEMKAEMAAMRAQLGEIDGQDA